MQTEGQRIIAGNAVNLVSGITRLTLGLGFLGLHQTPLLDSFFSPTGQEYPFLYVSEIFLSRPAISA